MVITVQIIESHIFNIFSPIDVASLLQKKPYIWILGIHFATLIAAVHVNAFAKKHRFWHFW